MAAGLGFKTFTTGEVLTAADTNGYLMQGVLVFASAAARDAAITSPQEGQFAYLKDTNVTTYYTGSAWANLDTTGMTNPMTTTGDTIYSSSGSTPARLGIGSTGQVLTVASGVPSWATPSGGSLTQLATGTLSGATTNVSGLSGSYKGLKAIVTSVTFASNGYNLELRFNNDSSALYRHANAFATQSDAVVSGTEMSAVFIGGTSSNKNVSVIDVWDYANTTHWKFCQTYGLSEGSTAGNINTIAGQGIYKSASAISAITFFADGDTFTGGTYTIYGVN